MKQTLYLETTIVSYLTAMPSHDLVVAAHQQVTRDWWDWRSAFDLYVSQFVLDEAGAGDAEAAERRLAALAEIPVLDLTTLLGLVRRPGADKSSGSHRRRYPRPRMRDAGREAAQPADAADRPPAGR